MSLNIGRTNETAKVTLDYNLCTSCGLCTRVCKGGPLYEEGGKVHVDPSRYWGCMGCGHCAAVCPRHCITVTGRDLNPQDITPPPPRDQRSSYESLRALMLMRRSVRNFKDQEVPREVLDKIIRAASSAPMGIPPSEVGVLVLAGKEKVTQFRKDLLVAARGMKRLFSPPLLWMFKPFLGKEEYQMMKAFVLPVLDTYLTKDKEGVDWFFYDAPLALYFYVYDCADPADTVISATYAMLAGESLGLGSCMLGFPGHLIKHSKLLKTKYQLPMKLQPGIAVVFGTPAIPYQRAIERRFANVRYA